MPPLPSLGFFSHSLPLLIQQSPSSGSDCGSETPSCFSLKNRVGGRQKKESFLKTPGPPRNIQMLSDSCLSPFPLLMVRIGEKCRLQKKGPTPTLLCTLSHICPHPPCSPLFPHSESVQQSPQQQQRQLITVKHLTLLFISLAAIATTAHKQRVWKQTQNREQREDNTSSFLCFWHGKAKEGPLW